MFTAKKKTLASVGLVSLLVTFFVFSLFSHFNRGDFSQNHTDPEYTILYNGVVVSTGSFAINYIDHPATPLIFISGASSLLVRIFSEHDSFVEHFIEHPDTYLDAAHLLMLTIIVSAIGLFLFKMLRQSTSVWIPIILGISLFSSHYLVSISSRLIPESLMLLPLFALIAESIFYLQQPNEKRKILKRMAFWVAFGIACKLHFAVMIFWPLALVEDRKALFTYFGRLALFVLILAYPLFTNFQESINWFYGMFKHSGMHGVGEAQIVDISNFGGNFRTLFFADITFMVLFGLSTLSAILLSLKTKKTAFQQALLRLNIGVSLSVLLLTLVVLKHFALHYFLPFYLLKGFLLILVVLSISTLVSSKYKAVLHYSGLMLMVCSVFYSANKGVVEYQDTKTMVIERKKAYNHVQSLITKKSAPLIINAEYWGAPFPEYAHAYGFMNSHKRKTYFKETLKTKYPNTFIYVNWSDKLNNWDSFTPYDEVFRNNSMVYFYSEKRNKALETIMQAVKLLEAEGVDIEVKTVYSKTGSNIQLLQFIQKQKV